MRIKIEVTTHDISRGKIGSAFNCPLARAIKRVCRVRSLVAIGSIIAIDFKQENVQFKHRVKTHNFVTAFDQGKDVKPFSFTLNIPKNFLCNKYRS